MPLLAPPRPPEIHPLRYATWRLMRRVAAWASVCPASTVAAMFDISESTVRRYELDVLHADLPEPLLDGIEILLVDEKAVRKGHGYVTLVLNGRTGELLHMAEGKKKESHEDFFDKYTEQVWEPKTVRVRKLFDDAGIRIPNQDDWRALKDSVAKHGIYNQNLQAVPPTGSISYINHSTSSIHPIASKVEIRKEGKIGRVYYPAPYMTNENLEYYQDAYEIGFEKIIDTYAAATQHVDQGLSLTLFFKDTATTRDVNKAQIYAWRKGIKTLYYIRLRQMALQGTEIENCVSCML